METNYDTVTEMKFAEARHNAKSKVLGARVQYGRCFLCGVKLGNLVFSKYHYNGTELCRECEKEFPVKGGYK